MASTPVSPKVTAGANWAGYATLILTLLNSVTPDMLSGLGKWSPLVSGLVVGLSYALGAYLKEDPLRTAGASTSPVSPDAVVDEIAARLTTPIIVKPVNPLPSSGTPAA
jgi:hypothetical protein